MVQGLKVRNQAIYDDAHFIYENSNYPNGMKDIHELDGLFSRRVWVVRASVRSVGEPIRCLSTSHFYLKEPLIQCLPIFQHSTILIEM